MDMARLLLYGEEKGDDAGVRGHASRSGGWFVERLPRLLERSREAPTVLPYLRFGNFAD